MSPFSAERQLEAIRSMMERAAVYRRALAPLTIQAGVAGVAVAGVGIERRMFDPFVFLGIWVVVAAGLVALAMVTVHRQATAAGEEVLSPPTRRVGAALLAPFVTGAVGGLVAGMEAVWLAPPIWMLCYALGLHSAGAFLPRQVRWFSWGLVAMGLVWALVLVLVPGVRSAGWGHLAMGVVFGVAHLAFGFSLRVVEAMQESR